MSVWWRCRSTEPKEPQHSARHSCCCRYTLLLLLLNGINKKAMTGGASLERWNGRMMMLLKEAGFLSTIGTYYTIRPCKNIILNYAHTHTYNIYTWTADAAKYIHLCLGVFVCALLPYDLLAQFYANIWCCVCWPARHVAGPDAAVEVYFLSFPLILGSLSKMLKCFPIAVIISRHAFPV